MLGLHFDPRPGAVEKFRARAGLVPSLVRKRCTCGVVVTAKQITQQGACDVCFKRAALFGLQISGARTASVTIAAGKGKAFAGRQKA